MVLIELLFLDFFGFLANAGRRTMGIRLSFDSSCVG
jgi:hypothetical protein